MRREVAGDDAAGALAMLRTAPSVSALLTAAMDTPPTGRSLASSTAAAIDVLPTWNSLLTT